MVPRGGVEPPTLGFSAYVSRHRLRRGLGAPRPAYPALRISTTRHGRGHAFGAPGLPSRAEIGFSSMMSAAQDLLEEAKKLPPDERQALAEALWETLETEPASLSPEWTAEVSSRI